MSFSRDASLSERKNSGTRPSKFLNKSLQFDLEKYSQQLKIDTKMQSRSISVYDTPHNKSSIKKIIVVLDKFEDTKVYFETFLVNESTSSKVYKKFGLFIYSFIVHVAGVSWKFFFI